MSTSWSTPSSYTSKSSLVRPDTSCPCSPITVADLECTWQAYLNTPGSLTTVGYDQITSVAQGESDKQAVISFATVYAPYKTLFNPILQASRHVMRRTISISWKLSAIHHWTAWRSASGLPRRSPISGGCRMRWRGST